MSEPRDQALRALYQADQLRLDHAPEEIEMGPKARRLTEGVLAHLPELDLAIEKVAENWKVSRMPLVDRAVLRLGVYELRYEPETPTPVILAEAVRVAKAFSTESSGRFVNGVLATLAAVERPDAT